MPMSQLFRDYLAHLEAAHSGYPVGLLSIQSSAGGEVLRLSSTAEHSVVSRGATYHRSGFDYRLPDRLSEGEQRCAFVLPVVDRTILAALRAHPERLDFTLEVVFSWTPDEVEIGPLRMVDVTRGYESATQTLTVECAFRDVLRNPRPGRKYTPAAFPGLFGAPNLQGVTP